MVHITACRTKPKSKRGGCCLRPEAAGYLLKYFPSLHEQAQRQAEDALEGNVAASLTENRHGQGGYTDQTARRGIALAEASVLADKLTLVRQWIDEELNPDDRLILLSVWRGNRWDDWHWVSREMRMGVNECRQRWNRLIQGLAAWLKGR